MLSSTTPVKLQPSLSSDSISSLDHSSTPSLPRLPSSPSVLSNSPSTAQSPSISTKLFSPSSHALQSPTTPSPLSNSQSINLHVPSVQPQHYPVPNPSITAPPVANPSITAPPVCNPLVAAPPVVSLSQVATPQVPFIQSSLPHSTLSQLPVTNAVPLHTVPLTPQLLNALVSQLGSRLITAAPQLQPVLRAQLLALQQQSLQPQPPNIQSLTMIRPNPTTTITSVSKPHLAPNAQITSVNKPPTLASNPHITSFSSSIVNPPVTPQQALTNNTMPTNNTSTISATSPNVESVIPHSTSIPSTNTSPVLFGQSTSVPSAMNTSDDVVVINDSFDELDKENKHTNSLKEGNGSPADSTSQRSINESDGMNFESQVEPAASAVDKEQSPSLRSNSEESNNTDKPDSSGLPSIVNDESVSSDSSSCVKQESSTSVDDSMQCKMRRSKRAASRTGRKPQAKRSKKMNQSSKKVNATFYLFLLF